MAIYHKHHIIPKHAGGTDDPSNLVSLTIEEHAETHKKLWEEYGRWQDHVAWQTLTSNISGEEARILAVKFSLIGKVKSDEHRHRISESQKKRYAERGNPTKGMKKKPATDERKRKISEANKGKSTRSGYKLSPEHKEKIRQAHLKRSTLSTTIEC
jgi:hypothetical protein